MRRRVDRGGRPAGRAPSGLELEHIELLRELRGRTEQFGRLYDERLENFILRLRDDGCSARSIATAMGVSPTMVQTWTDRARTRQSAGGS